MALEIGDVVDGKYKIIRLLGEGGMGAVFEGENTRIHRRVAIKVLHGGNETNEEAVTRFEREAQAAGRIGSEHIVEVLDLGDLPSGERYMVMEFLEGESLGARIARGKIAPRSIAQVALGLLDGLKAAHAAQIVHRDLKPDNVFLLNDRGGRKDFVKIVDFGISKFNALGGEFSMTRTGAVMGTPYYMAPEQAKGGSSVDHRADLYAVGVILYQAVVGHVPFQAETFNELLFKIVLETPPDLEERVPGIDPSFAHLVRRAMARDVDQRYQTADEFRTALQAWLGGAAIPAGDTMAGGTPVLDRTLLPQEVGPTMATPGVLAAPKLVGTQGAVGAARDNDVDGASDWGAAGIPGSRADMKKGLLAALMGLIVIGGGTFYLTRSGGEAVQESAAEAAAETQKLRAQADLKADAERDAIMAELRVEREKAREAREKAEAAKAEAEKNRTDAAAQNRAEEAASEAAAAAAASRPRAIPARRSPSARPQAAQSPPAAQGPQSAPAPKPSGGRIIRTDL